MKWLQRLLGIDKIFEAQERLSDRLIAVERHFVTKRDPTNGQPLETLADMAADAEGRPRPKALRIGRQWDQVRRYNEAVDAAAAMTKVRH